MICDLKVSIGRAKSCHQECSYDQIWYKADNPAVPAFVRFWTKADKVGLWSAMVCPLMTQSRHSMQVRLPDNGHMF
jgi:hypothetical protein